MWKLVKPADSLIVVAYAMYFVAGLAGKSAMDTATFTPSVIQIGGALLFIALGFAISTAVAHLGSAKPERLTVQRGGTQG